MACRYEEEIYMQQGKVEECGCPNCPYKNLIECKEISHGIRNVDKRAI